MASCLVLISLGCFVMFSAAKQPNIIVFMADDMGWQDVSFHGSNGIPTPNIDALAYYGISLNRHYTPALCTPSRGSVLTGKYPIHLGLQHYVIGDGEPWGLDLGEKILPQYLKEVGYSTALIGKWNLGFYRTEYTPTERGFDSFYGYYGGYIDYFMHTRLMKPNWAAGYDFRRNFTVDWDSKGEYVTTMLTNAAVETINNRDKSKPMFLMVNHNAPHAGNNVGQLESPPGATDNFEYIKNPLRRQLAAVISIMDSGIGNVITALESNGMLDNSVILFYSDNGAPSLGVLHNSGSNYPFKGQKDSAWEGAVRVPAAIWSPLLNNRERASNQLFHVSDWFPTFLTLAGVSPLPQGLDSYNIWDALSKNETSPRSSIVHNIDEYTSYMNGSFKYVKGNRLNGTFDWWIGDVMVDIAINNPYADIYYDLVRNSSTGQALSKYTLTGTPMSDAAIQTIRTASTIQCSKPRNECLPAVLPCLFDIEEDPCEHENLYSVRPSTVNEMEADILAIREGIIPARNQPPNANGNPALHGYTWTYWQRDI